MRILLVILVAAGCAKKPPATAKPEVAAAAPVITSITVPLPIDRVGERVDRHQDMRMSMMVRLAPDHTQQIDREQYTETTYEVLEVDDRQRASRMRITFSIVDVSQTGAGRLPSLRAGKTYEVWRDAAGVHVSRAGGGRGSGDEMAEVRKELSDFGEPDPHAAVIAGKTWNVGQEYAFSDADLAPINRSLDGGQMTAMSYRLRKIEGDVAHFEMKATHWTTTAKGSLRAQLAGHVEINWRTGDMLDMSLTGPADGNLGAPMRGTMSIRTYIP